MDFNIIDLIHEKKAGNYKSHSFTETQIIGPFIKSVLVAKIFVKKLI